MEHKINGTQLNIVQGLLGFSAVDAFIHPTNSYLWFAGAYERLKEIGGDNLETEAIEQGPIAVGTAIIANAGRLNATHIIHAATWGHDLIPKQPEIHRGLVAALDLAEKNFCRSLAIPIAGSTIASFPLPAAIEVTFMTVIEHCLKSDCFDSITLLAANNKEYEVLTRLMKSVDSANPVKEENQ